MLLCIQTCYGDPSHIALCLAYLDKTSSIRKSAIFIRVKYHELSQPDFSRWLSLAVHFLRSCNSVQQLTSYLIALIVHNVNLYTCTTRRALCTLVLSFFCDNLLCYRKCGDQCTWLLTLGVCARVTVAVPCVSVPTKLCQAWIWSTHMAVWVTRSRLGWSAWMHGRYTLTTCMVTLHSCGKLVIIWLC